MKSLPSFRQSVVAALAIQFFLGAESSRAQSVKASCAFVGSSPLLADGRLAPSAQRDRVVGIFDDENGRAMEGVSIVDLLNQHTATTGATGTATLGFLSRPSGTPVLVRHIGYIPIDTTFTCTEADTVDVTLVMRRGSSLPAVVTTTRFDINRDPGRRNTFFERCSRGKPRCYGPEQLDQFPSRNIGDLVRAGGDVGVSVCRVTQQSIGGRRTSSCGTMRANGTGRCTPTEYLNGLLWNGEPNLLAPDAANPPFRAADVAGIEVYRSGINKPLRWVGSPTDPLDNCGSIVVWLK